MSEIVEYFNFVHIQRFFSFSHRKNAFFQNVKVQKWMWNILESRKIKIGTAVLQQMRIKHGMATNTQSRQF